MRNAGQTRKKGEFPLVVEQIKVICQKHFDGYFVTDNENICRKIVILIERIPRSLLRGGCLYFV